MTLIDDIFYGDTAFDSPEVYNYGNKMITTCHIGGADPLFVNAASGDLHLKAGSPCIHVGSALPPGTTDLDGTPYGSPSPSLGAYEYGLYTVTNTHDDGAGSLRAAIVLANAHSGSVISFAPGLSGTILLESSLPALTADMTITGPGAALLAVDGGGKYQPFSVYSGVTLSGLTIQNGGGGNFSAVMNYDTLTLTDCTLIGNAGSFGGGIENVGRLTLIGCTLTGNSATYGGGILNAGTLTLTGCTLTGNSATSDGGGIYNNPYGTLTLTDDILYGDKAPTGNEIENSGSTSVAYCDIQQAGYAGSSGNLNANPRLSALGYHGGPTQTFALLPGSPCLGAGIAVSGLTADPRGVAIPQNGRYDIGAFESQGFTVTVTGGSGQSAAVGTAFAQSLTATVRANDLFELEPVVGGVVVLTAPGGGASATFSLASVTGGSVVGGAISATAMANGVVGSYSALADTGAGSASYSLSNTQGVTSVALTSSLNPSQFGQSVTFKATVTGQNPGGSVTFTIDGTAGAPITLSGGSAISPATTTLAAGSHTVTATYSGDTNNAASSGTVTQTVSQATVTSVAAGWGTQTAPATTASILPWLGISRLVVTLSASEALPAGDVTVTGVSLASYGPVTVSGSGTTYTLTLARPISAADRVTLTLGNAGISTSATTFAVLPGDLNGDGVVNAQDLVLSRNAIGTANVQGDINGDGADTAADYALIRARIGTRLP